MIPGGLSLWVVLPLLFLVGAWIGRFLNVCIDRFPKHESFLDQLKSLKPQQRWWQLDSRRNVLLDSLPVIGWLFVVRRVKTGHAAIPLRYPLLELLNGALFAALYWLEIPAVGGFEDSPLYLAIGPKPQPDSFLFSPMAILHWRYLSHLVLVECLLVATWIDLEWTIIPDGATVPAMIIGLLGGWLGCIHLVPLWFQEVSLRHSLTTLVPESWLGLILPTPVPLWVYEHPHLHGFLTSLAGLIVGGGMIWLVRIIGERILRQEAMGFGDVTLMAAIGSFLGWQPVVMVFFIAPICALLFVVLTSPFRFGQSLPYGPWLSLAALLVLFQWPRLWQVGEWFFSWGPLLVPLALIMVVLMIASLQLAQGVKWVLGIPLYPEEEWMEDWTSADMLIYQAGERADEPPSAWEKEAWPGTSSGTGQNFLKEWRNGE